jgi:hypothetical protein
LRWRYLFDMVKLLSVRYIIYVIENKINGYNSPKVYKLKS